MNYIEWLRELNHVYEEADEVTDEIERLQRENEELREEVASFQEELRLCQQDAINALKAQSTEPVVWEEAQETAYWDFDARRKGYPPYKGRPQSERDAFKQVLRNTTPPTAPALVDDFKRRAVETCIALIHDGNSEQCCMGAMWASERIRALPLIEDFNQGEK